MALSNETKSWLEELKKEGALSDEAFNTLKSSLEANAKGDEFIKGSQLRQSDYSRAMSGVTQAQKDLEAAQAQLIEKEKATTKFQSDLGAWKTTADGTVAKAQREREDAEAKVAKATARLRSLAVSVGMTEEDLLKDLEVTPSNQPVNKEQTVDTSKFVTREQIQQTIRESAFVDASIHDLSQEYFELTGQPLRGASKLVEEAIAASKPLNVYISEKYKFGELREKKNEEAIQKRIDEAVTAKTASILSDAALGGGGQRLVGRTDLGGSPILSHGDFKPPSDGQNGVSAAVAAFQASKYKR